MSVLEIKNIVYEVSHKKILDDFSLKIEASEVHALLGTNGTGKSTLAYLIMGCEGYRPTSGEIVFEGKVINDLKIHVESVYKLPLRHSRENGNPVPKVFETASAGIDMSLWLTKEHENTILSPFGKGG